MLGSKVLVILPSFELFKVSFFPLILKKKKKKQKEKRKKNIIYI